MKILYVLFVFKIPCWVLLKFTIMILFIVALLHWLGFSILLLKLEIFSRTFADSDIEVLFTKPQKLYRFSPHPNIATKWDALGFLAFSTMHPRRGTCKAPWPLQPKRENHSCNYDCVLNVRSTVYSPLFPFKFN